MSIFGNDQDLSNLRKDVEALQQQVKDIMEKITPTDTPDTEVKPVVTVSEETVKEEPKKEVVEVQQTTADCTPQIEAFKADIKALAEMIDTATYQEGIIRDLHEELQTYKKGLIADISKGYVMDIVRIYDRLADTNAHFNPEEEGFDPARIKKLFENNLYAITDMLEDQYSIESFTPEAGSPYNPKEHKAMQVLEAEDEALASTVVKCLAPGFRNTDTGRLVRQARIVVYKRKDA